MNFDTVNEVTEENQENKEESLSMMSVPNSNREMYQEKLMNQQEEDEKEEEKVIELESKKKKSPNDYMDFEDCKGDSLIKPHLLSFFNHVFIDSAKVFEDFSKYTSNICALVQKETKRLDELSSYKVDYPKYLFGRILKIFNKMLGILIGESSLVENNEEHIEEHKFRDDFKNFARSLLHALTSNMFDKEMVIIF